MQLRIAAFLLGCWLLGSLFITFVATENFHTVDAVLSSPPPEASKMIQTLGDQNARQLLRYLAGEENRGYFQAWELAQLALGTALVGFLLFGIEKRLLAGLAGAMLILTLFQHFKITLELDWTGRSIDFAPAEPQARDQFWKLHGIYSRNRSGKDAAGRDHCWLSISDAPTAIAPARSGFRRPSGSPTESDTNWLVSTKEVRSIQMHGAGSELSRISSLIPEQFALRYARTNIRAPVVETRK